jgi:2-phosphoglycerate kinase
MDDNWKVLLIGGASGTGKTAVAQRLARRFGVSVLLADDIRMALQRLTTAEQNPTLHVFAGQGEIWDHSADALRSGWIGVSQVVSKALEAVIAHHLAVESAGPIIIEGDCVDPRLATLEQYAWYPGGEGVKSVVLYEPEDTVLLGNMRRRGRGFGEGSFQEQITYARGASWFGQWLKQEAEGCGIPVLTSRPWETLEERILEAVGCPVASEQHPA